MNYRDKKRTLPWRKQYPFKQVPNKQCLITTNDAFWFQSHIVDPFYPIALKEIGLSYLRKKQNKLHEKTLFNSHIMKRFLFCKSLNLSVPKNLLLYEMRKMYKWFFLSVVTCFVDKYNMTRWKKINSFFISPYNLLALLVGPLWSEELKYDLSLPKLLGSNPTRVLPFFARLPTGQLLY